MCVMFAGIFIFPSKTAFSALVRLTTIKKNYSFEDMLKNNYLLALGSIKDY